ncbi:MAG: glycosyltransferase family 9 protein [Deferribacteraceae bacterium]|jgi:heptosyltransferase-2|nr:glycosyltransferase family 9 protein [Deferribacteraceae bacterium]
MNSVKRVLIVKLSALGDAVMASAIIPALRERYGNLHISWLAGVEIAELVALYEGVDKLYIVDNSLLAKGFFSRVKLVAAVWKLLFAKRFDLVITAHSNYRYKVLPLSAFCKDHVSFGGREGPLPGRYHAVEYARLALSHDAEILNFPPFAKLKEIPIAEESRDHILLLPGGALNMLSNISLRRWDAENYAALAKRLIEKGYKVGLIGSATDRWTEQYFRGLPITSFIGKTDIKGLIALIKGACALVAHDSGPFHIACMVGAPLVGLFGPINSKFRHAPNKNIAVIDGKTVCSPCYDGRFYADCRDNICMRSISVEQVLAEVVRIAAKPI